MITCPICGEDNPVDNEYCVNCGASLEQTDLEEIEEESLAEEGSEEEVLQETPSVLTLKKAVLVLPDGSQLPIEDRKDFGRSDIVDAVSSTEASWVSREHFSITRQDGKFYVEDSGSTNGTRLDGEDIQGTGPKELNEGDIITLADSIDIEFKTAE